MFSRINLDAPRALVNARDKENQPVIIQTPVAQPVGTREELLRENRRLQIANSALVKESEEARLQAAGLKFDQGDPSLTLTKVESATLRFAKLYVVAGAIWPPVEANTLQASRLASEGYDPLQRYPLELSTAESSLASDNGTILGAVHEFYVLMPEDLRVQTLPSSFFKKVFKDAADYRSTLQNLVRSHAAELLRGLASMSVEEIMDAMTADQRGTNDNFRSLLGYNTDHAPDVSPYALMPPILLGGNENDDELDRMFRNPIIERILVLICFGPAALRGGRPWKPHSAVNNTYWKLKEVNASMVALAAVLARFLISPGTFREHGDSHSAQWRGEYEKYKKLLWDCGAEWVDNLLRDLTKKVFGGPPSISRLPRPVEQTNVSTEFNRLLLATRASRRAAQDRQEGTREDFDDHDDFPAGAYDAYAYSEPDPLSSLMSTTSDRSMQQVSGANTRPVAPSSNLRSRSPLFTSASLNTPISDDDGISRTSGSIQPIARELQPRTLSMSRGDDAQDSISLPVTRRSIVPTAPLPSSRALPAPPLNPELSDSVHSEEEAPPIRKRRPAILESDDEQVLMPPVQPRRPPGRRGNRPKSPTSGSVAKSSKAPAVTTSTERRLKRRK